MSYSVGRKGREKRGEDWLREGTSRANIAGDGVGDATQMIPGWLAREDGDVVEGISEKGSTAQVYVLRSLLD